jgi:hypothetical protein
MLWYALLSPTLAGPVPPSLTDFGVVLEAPETGLFQEGVNSPSIGYDEARGIWHLYFESPVPDDEVNPGCEKGTRIGHASSTDGVDWTLSPDAVLEPVEGSDWGCGAAHPSVIFDGDYVHLFFAASDVPDTEGGQNAQTGIGYAISTDGQNFMVEGLIAENPQDESGGRAGVGFPTVVLVDDTMVLLFVRSPEVYKTWSSDQGQTWTEDTDPVLTPDTTISWASDRLNGPSMVCHETGALGLSVLIGGKDSDGTLTLGTARSTPGNADWTLNDAPVMVKDPGWTHWDLALTDTGRLVYYSAEQDDGRKGIGFAATDLSFTTPMGRICQRPE